MQFSDHGSIDSLYLPVYKIILYKVCVCDFVIHTLLIKG